MAAERRRAREPASTPLTWVPGILLAVVLVVILVAVNVSPAGPPTPSGPYPISGPIRSATLADGPAVGVHGVSPFFAVNLNTVGTRPQALAALGSFYNSTPIHVFRFGGPWEGYDPTTQTLYEAPTNGSTYVATPFPASQWNFTWMAAYCRSGSTPCVWLGNLPAEENDTRAAVHVAEWFHEKLGFVPTYWEFDNEPDAWTHYGENRTTWSTLDHRTPTALDYATMVRNYIAAVRTLYPTDEFVGIESAQPRAGAGLATETAALDGAQVAALAYHYYPSISGSSTSLSQFYGDLVSPFNLTWSMNAFRAAITQNCATCANLPIQIGEYQAGPAQALSPFVVTYAGAPFLAASIIEALRVNVSMFTTFNSGSLVNSSSGTILPEGLLYQRILENLTMGTDYATTLSSPGVGGLFSVRIQNGTHESLLLVNTNTTYALRLPVAGSVFPVGATGSWWVWGPMVSAPLSYRSVPLPTSYLIPQQGIVLLDNY